MSDILNNTIMTNHLNICRSVSFVPTGRVSILSQIILKSFLVCKKLKLVLIEHTRCWSLQQKNSACNVIFLNDFYPKSVSIIQALSWCRTAIDMTECWKLLLFRKNTFWFLKSFAFISFNISDRVTQSV